MITFENTADRDLVDAFARDVQARIDAFTNGPVALTAEGSREIVAMRKSLALFRADAADAREATGHGTGIRDGKPVGGQKARER